MKTKSDLLLDTNVILRYLLRDNEKQYREIEPVFEHIRTSSLKAHLLEGVLAECVYVLDKFYRVPRQEIAQQLESLLVYKGLLHDEKEALIEALRVFGTTSLDIVDALALTIAQKRHVRILTFDKGLLRKQKL